VGLKAALVIGGGPKWPDGEKLKRARVTRLYYEGSNLVIDAAFAKQIRDWGYEMGLMQDPIWDNYNLTPEDWINKRVNPNIARLAPKGPDGKRPQLAVMLDIERHDEAWVRQALTEFRRTNPGRNVIWTMEYHQGGWFSPDLVSLINGYPQLRVLPQLYYGDMSNCIDSHAAARDLYTLGGAVTQEAGIQDNRLGFFYSLRVPIPHDWDGCLYLENWTQLP
jgi:hypothetical protein